MTQKVLDNDLRPIVRDYHVEGHQICDVCKGKREEDDSEQCTCILTNYNGQELAYRDGKLVEGGHWMERLDTLRKEFEAKRRGMLKAIEIDGAKSPSRVSEEPASSENQNEAALFTDVFAKQNRSRALDELATARLKMAHFLTYLKPFVNLDDYLSESEKALARSHGSSAAKWTDPE